MLGWGHGALLRGAGLEWGFEQAGWGREQTLISVKTAGCLGMAGSLLALSTLPSLCPTPTPNS